MPKRSQTLFPVVHEVWVIKKVPGEWKRIGVFVDPTEAAGYREEIKYTVDCAKTQINDRRV